VEILVRANLEVAGGRSNFCLSQRGASGTKFHDFTEDFLEVFFFCFVLFLNEFEHAFP
jgi:hypothetical protein